MCARQKSGKLDDAFDDSTKSHTRDPSQNVQNTSNSNAAKRGSEYETAKKRWDPMKQMVYDGIATIKKPFSFSYWKSSQTQLPQLPPINHNENEKDENDGDEQNDIQMTNNQVGNSEIGNGDIGNGEIKNGQIENNEVDYDENNQDLMNMNHGGINNIQTEKDGMNNDDENDQDKMNGDKNKNVKKIEIEQDYEKMRNCQIENNKMENDQNEMKNDIMNDCKFKMENNEIINNDFENKIKVNYQSILSLLPPNDRNILRNIKKENNVNLNEIEIEIDYNKLLLLLESSDRSKLRRHEELKTFYVTQQRKMKDMSEMRKGVVILLIISKYDNNLNSLEGNKNLKEDFIEIFQNGYHYDVFYPDQDKLNSEEAVSFLKETKKKIMVNGDYDGLFFILAGHGQSDGLICSDESKSILLFAEIFTMLRSDEFMVGLPKIFFMDCCLGNDILRTKDEDGNTFEYKKNGETETFGTGGNGSGQHKFHCSQSNALICWSNIPGHTSFGQVGIGGFMNKHLKWQLKNGVKDEGLSIGYIVRQVSKEVHKENGGIQCVYVEGCLVNGDVKIRPNIHKDEDKDILMD